MLQEAQECADPVRHGDRGAGRAGEGGQELRVRGEERRPPVGSYERRAVYESDWVGVWLEDVETPDIGRVEDHVVIMPCPSTTVRADVGGAAVGVASYGFALV